MPRQEPVECWKPWPAATSSPLRASLPVTVPFRRRAREPHNNQCLRRSTPCAHGARPYSAKGLRAPKARALPTTPLPGVPTRPIIRPPPSSRRWTIGSGGHGCNHHGSYSARRGQRSVARPSRENEVTVSVSRSTRRLGTAHDAEQGPGLPDQTRRSLTGRRNPRRGQLRGDSPRSRVSCRVEHGRSGFADCEDPAVEQSDRDAAVQGPVGGCRIQIIWGGGQEFMRRGLHGCP